MKPDHPIHIFINKHKYEIADATEAVESLKALAGIPLGDVLFLQEPGEDLVVANETSVTLKNGDHLHSQPPADYGAVESVVPLELEEAGIEPARVTVHAAPDGWSFLVISDYPLPEGYVPNRVQLLLKLPPTFPDAAPDMFWVLPTVRSPNGTLPRSTSPERLLGEDWQRFSWHLASGAWTPGVSTIRDFLRCVAARFQRLD